MQDLEYRSGGGEATVERGTRRWLERNQETDIRYSRTASKTSRNSARPSSIARKN
jgi:hypothetical protein